MVKLYSPAEKTQKKQVIGIDDNCTNRIKPSILRDVKTEALLVFVRTALERFFTQIEEIEWESPLASEKDTEYVYATLRGLRDNLQECVVNVDYLISVMQAQRANPAYRSLAKFEEPLILYYDAMAQKVSNHFEKRSAYIPEFLIVCVLSHWILEEEKSVDLYPFLKEIDFMGLIDIFEDNRATLQKDDLCITSDIHTVSLEIVEQLKARKYKVNSNRVSKTRKKK
jgi:hypothetical protein